MKSQLTEITDQNTRDLLILRRMRRIQETEGYHFYVPLPYEEHFHSCIANRVVIHGGNRAGKNNDAQVRTLKIMEGKDPLCKLKGWEPPIRWRWCGTGKTEQVLKVIVDWFRRLTPRDWFEDSNFKYNAQTGIIEFAERGPCRGGFVELMSYDQDPTKGSGRPLHGVAIDEAYDCPERFRAQCLSRLADYEGVAWAIETPENGDATWTIKWVERSALRTVYDEEANEIRVVRDNTKDVDYATFCYPTRLNRFLYTDNDFSKGSPAIKQILKDCEDAENPDVERRIRLNGEFVVIGGLVYQSLDPAFHVKHPIEFGVDGTWTQYVSIDPGIRKDHRVTWHCVGPPRQMGPGLEAHPVYFYRDAYIPGTMEDLCLGIRKEGGSEAYAAFNFDPNWDWDNKAAADDYGTPFNLQTKLREAMDKTGYQSVPLVPARKDKSVWLGIDQVRQLMKVRKPSELPMLAFSPECHALFSEMRGYKCVRKKEREPTAHRPRIRKIDDDGPDCVRIAVTSPMQYVGGSSFFTIPKNEVATDRYGLGF